MAFLLASARPFHSGSSYLQSHVKGFGAPGCKAPSTLMHAALVYATPETESPEILHSGTLF